MSEDGAERVAHVDPVGGASGDMLLAAAVDAGLPLDDLRAALAALPLAGWSIEGEEALRGGVRATRLLVRTGTTVESAAGARRDLAAVLALLDRSALPESDRAGARRVFTRLADAEAAVHGVPVEQVHFHEVGAVDSILDIVGFVVALRLLGVRELTCGPLPAGGGTTRSEHGPLPAPGPATLRLLADAGAPLRSDPAMPAAELVTPTAAALLCELARFTPATMTLRGVGTGAGTRDFADWPNVCRLWLGESAVGGAARELRVLETNVDDMNPEWFALGSERCLQAGALDVWLTPVQMKKGRPALVMSALCAPEREADVAMAMLRETTTLGVRAYAVRRYEAERELREVETPYGRARVKLKRLGPSGEGLTAAPEYEDCARLARERGVPLAEVYRAVAEAARAAG